MHFSKQINCSPRSANLIMNSCLLLSKTQWWIFISEDSCFYLIVLIWRFRKGITVTSELSHVMFLNENSRGKIEKGGCISFI